MSVLTDISKSYSERQKGSQNAHMLGCQVRIWIGWNLGWNTCAFPRWQVVKQKVEARLLFCLCSKLTWNDLPVNKQTLMVKSWLCWSQWGSSHAQGGVEGVPFWLLCLRACSPWLLAWKSHHALPKATSESLCLWRQERSPAVMTFPNLPNSMSANDAWGKYPIASFLPVHIAVQCAN